MIVACHRDASSHPFESSHIFVPLATNPCGVASCK